MKTFIKMPFFWALASACVLLLSSGLPAAGQQPDARDLREKADDLESKARDLKAAGERDRAQEAMQQADELRRKARNMMAQREPGPGEGQPGMAKRMRRGPGPGPGGSPGPEQRLQHLQVAIENLHAAGMHEAANRLARLAELMRESMGAQRPMGRMPAMREGEIERLRAEIQELRENMKEMRDQMEKLRGEPKMKP